jgi:hypothetical protein
MKLVWLIKLYLHEHRSEGSVGQHLSEKCPTQNGLLIVCCCFQPEFLPEELTNMVRDGQARQGNN